MGAKEPGIEFPNNLIVSDGDWFIWEKHKIYPNRDMIDDPHCFLGRHGTKPPTRQNIPKQRDSSALKMGMTEQNCPWHGIGWYDIY